MNDPNEALQKMLQGSGLSGSSFSPTSRYYGVETAKLTTADGRIVAYVRRRFVPPAEEYSTLQEHTVTQGDRLDNIAAKYLGDPEQFWRICDANAAMRPDELTENIGATIRITLPHGVPGVKDA
jgi:nucleoid-associated protein YgaU